MRNIYVALQDSAIRETLNTDEIKNVLIQKGLDKDRIFLEVVPEMCSFIATFAEYFFANRNDGDILIMISSSRIYQFEPFHDSIEVSHLAKRLKDKFPNLKYAISTTAKEQAEYPIDFCFDKGDYRKRSETLAENIFEIYTKIK